MRELHLTCTSFCDAGYYKAGLKRFCSHGYFGLGKMGLRQPGGVHEALVASLLVPFEPWSKLLKGVAIKIMVPASGSPKY